MSTNTEKVVSVCLRRDPARASGVCGGSVEIRYANAIPHGRRCRRCGMTEPWTRRALGTIVGEPDQFSRGAT
jgi:hypothetical protein